MSLWGHRLSRQSREGQCLRGKSSSNLNIVRKWLRKHSEGPGEAVWVFWGKLPDSYTQPAQGSTTQGLKSACLGWEIGVGADEEVKEYHGPL